MLEVARVCEGSIGDARVADEDVDPAEALRCRVHQRPDVLFHGDVARLKARLPAAGFDLADDRVPTLAVATPDHDLRAALCGDLSRGGADPARSAGDDEDQAVEIHERIL